MRHTLYGAPHSLYTGKARCYLRKQGIAYRELMPSHPSYVRDIAPTIGRTIIPVIVTPAGEIIQDTIDIIDHFEVQGVRYPAYPTSPLLGAIAIILEYYGGQCLLKHAMHYRWSYREEQSAFLERCFGARAPAGAAEKIMARMQSYLPQLGVDAQSIPLIERSYAALLDILNAHFAAHPYVLGGRPSIADYGLIGPLFAHLGRDPVPERIMKLRAPNVSRWVERMNAPDLDTPEFPDRSAEFFPDDALPVTLEQLLAHVAAEIFPELTDKLAFLDDWVATHRPGDGDPVGEKPHQRRLGVVHTRFRGAPIEAGVEPYLVYVLRRADRLIGQLNETRRTQIHERLAELGLHGALLGERGGALAGFAHPTLTRAAQPGEGFANYHLLDAIAALRWMKANAAAFGGDANNVTLFGESAGATMVANLLTSPLARGLFQKAIVESTGSLPTPATSLAKAEAAGAALATSHGLPGKDATLQQLRAIPADAIIAHATGRGLRTILDGRVKKQSIMDSFASGTAIDVPTIIGTNSDEGRLSGTQRVATYAMSGAPVWQYFFDYVPDWRRPEQPNGAPHAAEIPYVFDTVSKDRRGGSRMTSKDHAVAAYIHSCWVAFANAAPSTKTLKCANGFEWPARAEANGQTVAIFQERPSLGQAPQLRSPPNGAPPGPTSRDE